MLPITCIAPVPGPVGLPIVFGYHLFQVAPDGQLEHWIDSQLRATVPPEGWESYAQAWPQCADLVSQLRRAPAVSSSPSALAAAVAQATAALKSALKAAGQ